jgi:hypothetical protein
MKSEFKFFRGYIKKTLTVNWNNDIIRNFQVEDELVRILSEEMAREIDNEIIQRLTRQINGGNRA